MSGLTRRNAIAISGGDFFRASGNVFAADFVTIDGVTFEWSTSAVASGHVLVDMSAIGAAPWAATVAMPILAATINVYESCPFYARATSGGYLSLIPKRTGPNVYALAFSGANLAASAATSTGLAAEGASLIFVFARLMTANDVAILVTVLGTAVIPVCVVHGAHAEPVLYGAVSLSPLGVSVNLSTGTFAWVNVADDTWVLTYAEPVGGALLGAADTIRVVVGPGI